MYETYYDKLQPCFGQENLQLHYDGTDSIILILKTQNIIIVLKKMEDIFVFINLDGNPE